MALKKLPKSTARTAWDLLVDVKRAITEEPKRVNMGHFIRKHLPTRGGPACGTTGCFAGWVNILSGHQGDDYGHVTAAMNVLGPNLSYYFRDPIAGYTRSYFNEGGGDSCETTHPGTRAHARAVCQRITRFMVANKTQLKERNLVRIGDKLEVVLLGR